MTEYWVVLDKGGVSVAFNGSLATAGLTCQHMDKEFARHAPHRVVHLVEARTQDVCWHCHDVLEPQGRPHCHRCPADGECDEEGCDAPGCRGEVPTNVCTVDPELEEVVKMAWATTVAETDDAHWFEFQKLAGLMRGLAVRKPHQLRACGIEVDDEH